MTALLPQLGRIDTSQHNLSSSPTPSHINNHSGSYVVNLYASNVRGLRTKSKMVYRNSSTWDYDIYAITETWLQDGIASSEYFDSCFNVLRKDRNQTGSSNNRSGGVLIAIRSHFDCSEVSIDGSTSIECICVKIKLNNNTNVFIFNSYVPPTSPKPVKSFCTLI